MPTAVFVSTGYGNWVAEGQGFYVSFKPANALTGERADLVGMLAMLGSALAGNAMPADEEPETALYHRDSDTWYILTGDLCAEYAPEIARGFDACLAVYRRNICHRSPWSTDDP
jgi:hypothetical protein